MNPYLIIGIIVAALVGGFKLGSDHELATQAREDKVAKDTRELALKVSSDAIAGIKPKYTTIQGKLEKEYETNTVYRDCKLSPNGLLLLNNALQGGGNPFAIGEGKLSPADATGQ